ncbi:hypothetical protein GORBP_028_00540 [Gordonia rubripertincta NBRC 101908]|uniref:Uncharacterized protein n=1 Tax=Gordonia rubripertincta NBRC 101908 TaxID=1077975 RepID=A0ABQ0HP62_GORRU|nr:hypothetical protein GORBP_028_00540 [Gordonia rubripertincta NBRC 101908]
MKAVTVLLLCAVVLASTASFAWPRPNKDRKPAARPSRRRSPILALNEELFAARAQRNEACDALRAEVLESVALVDQIPEGRAAGHVVLALDVWSGRDFTQRNRAVGLGWLPFVDPPEHEETDETREARLDRVYDLNKTERAEVEGMRDDLVGRFAYVAGLIAARIHAYPAWRLDFFDEHNVRIDLAAQVSAIAASAALLRDQRALLGEPPAGHLAKDDDVVGVYVEKARVLDSRADGLLRRVQAFAEYREVVDGVQKREDKRAWFDRVGAIDELEHAVDDVVNASETDHLRGVAGNSAVLATLYLDTLEPLTASLTVSESRKS